ncbi:discoidin domain-containing protein, partial [Salmonella sp. s51933]|uniref:discoidin domain-containing protein n=1 Tax=Salmonella sp. s51933 TaxID=3160127 RepID=UPI0037553966
REGTNFKQYEVGGQVKVFPGNRDRDTIVRNSVSPVIITRYIRIHPKSWYGHISMRVEFVGCIKEWPCDTQPCLNGGTCLEYRGKYLCSCADGFSGKNC